MKLYSSLFAAFVVLALLAGPTPSVLKADEATVGKGTVKGKVTDLQDKPVAHAKVMLVVPGQGKQGKRAAGGPANGGRATSGPRPEPIATTETDENGVFTMSAAPAGNWLVVCRSDKNVGRERVVVTAGGTIETKVVVKPRPEGKKGHRRGGGAQKEKEVE